MLPNVFHDIQIRTLCRPAEEVDTPLLTIICGDFGSMWGCIILLEDIWLIFITINGRNALGEVFLQQRDIFFCIHFLVTHHQSSDAIRLNAPPKHDGEGILEGWLENSGLYSSEACICGYFFSSKAGTLVVVGTSYVRYNGLQCGKSQPPCNSTNCSFPPFIKFAWTSWSVLS